MIQEPPIDKLVDTIGSRYALCVIVSKRARELSEQAHNQGLSELPGKYKPITAAAHEVLNGKLTISNE